MATWQAVFQRILNPRPDLSGLSNRKPENEGTRVKPRVKARHVLLNLPLVLGGLIVLGLFLMVLFGPLWAPENPYLAGQRTITYEDGELSAPPFPPSDEFPLGTDQWGKDILSLLLYGARNTLVACLFIAMARLLLGLVLGALAGWNESKFVDRAVMGAIGLTTALPILLSSMILIYALDIRRGLLVFIIAMSIVGWAEVAQYIRSEFIVLRQKPFIEGAHATGLPGLGIAVRHVLPNILPHLVVITLLEMSAVLILLGELGFIGVFIGGGTQTTDFSDRQITIPDIPEWGAMLAGSREWARAKPWIIFYPALAFFVAVVGFNALAEGIRRLVEQAAVSTAFLLRRRMIFIVAVITAATIYIINNIGPAPSFARLANDFNGESAYEHVQFLTQLAERGPGQPGSQAAADYIATHFKIFGLQPAGEGGTYFQTLSTRLVRPVEQPRLALLAEDGQLRQDFRHQQDFGFVIDGHGGSGTVQASLNFVGFQPGNQDLPWDVYQGLDLQGKIVLLLVDNAPGNFPTEALIRGAVGVLWVTDDGLHAVRSQIQLPNPEADYLRSPTIPIFRIRPAMAEAILAPAGINLDVLRRQIEDWPANREQPWLVRELETQVRMSLTLTEPEVVEVVNVLGYLPGQDVIFDDQLVIAAAHYDSLSGEPDGTFYPAANDNASGVAILLETIRLWQERGLTPRRTVLFAAWGGGHLDYSGAEAYLNGYLSGISLLHPVAIFQLDNLGAGGEELRLYTASTQLTDLLSDSAVRTGLSIRREEGSYHAYQELVKREIPSALISWADSQAVPQHDILERIDREKLSTAGQTISLALTNIARLPDY